MSMFDLRITIVYNYGNFRDHTRVILRLCLAWIPPSQALSEASPFDYHLPTQIYGSDNLHPGTLVNLKVAGIYGCLGANTSILIQS